MQFHGEECRLETTRRNIWDKVVETRSPKKAALDVFLTYCMSFGNSAEHNSMATKDIKFGFIDYC
jgi:hypothetical protein